MSKKQDWKQVAKKALDEEFDEEIPRREVFKDRNKKKASTKKPSRPKN